MESDWRTYRDQMFSESGSKTFLSELYPLPKKGLDSWPVHYKEIFELSKDDSQEYISLVRKYRFPLLRSLWNEYNPSMTICFGERGWEDFKLLLNIKNEKAERFANEKIQYYKESRVLLTPFFGLGRMSHELIDQIVLIAKDKID